MTKGKNGVHGQTKGTTVQKIRRHSNDQGCLTLSKVSDHGSPELTQDYSYFRSRCLKKRSKREKKNQRESQKKYRNACGTATSPTASGRSSLLGATGRSGSHTRDRGHKNAAGDGRSRGETHSGDLGRGAHGVRGGEAEDCSPMADNPRGAPSSPRNPLSADRRGVAPSGQGDRGERLLHLRLFGSQDTWRRRRRPERSRPSDCAGDRNRIGKTRNGTNDHPCQKD